MRRYKKRKEEEKNESEAEKAHQHGAAIRAARLISRAPQSVAAAPEDHRASLTPAKQSQQVAEEERESIAMVTAEPK